MKLFALTIAAIALAAAAAAAQTPPPADPGNMNRFGRAITARYDAVKRDIVEAAEAMPEPEYSFRATPRVRTFAEIIGHIADSQNFFCGVAGGNNPEYVDTIETSRGTKAALVNALKDSVARCDEVYGRTDPTNALALVPAVTFRLRGLTVGRVLLDPALRRVRKDPPYVLSPTPAGPKGPALRASALSSPAPPVCVGRAEAVRPGVS